MDRPRGFGRAVPTAHDLPSVSRMRVLVLGAGFGGLELAAFLSERFGDDLDLVLIDKRSTFVFGFSKLDVMFGRSLPQQVSHSYAGRLPEACGSWSPPSAGSTRR